MFGLKTLWDKVDFLINLDERPLPQLESPSLEEIWTQSEEDIEARLNGCEKRLAKLEAKYRQLKTQKVKLYNYTQPRGLQEQASESAAVLQD